jgi:hypothetical protein
VLCPGKCLPAFDTIVTGLVRYDLANRFELIEVKLLRYQPEAGFGGGEVGFEIVPEDGDFPRGLIDEGGDDADGGRLAGAVGTQ